MDRDTAVGLVQQRLGFRKDLTSEIISVLQEVQAEFELRPFLPWWLIEEWATGTTIANDRRVPLPADFIRGVERAHLYYRDSESADHKMVKDDYDRLHRAYKEATGAPERYDLLGGYLFVFPIPDAEYSLRWLYYAKDTVLTSNVENKWLKNAPHLLIDTTAARMGEDLGMPDGSIKRLQARADRAYAELIASAVAREATNDEVIIEGDL